MEELVGKKILIIGGTGSLGKALVRRLSSDNELVIVSRDELKQWTMRNDLLEGQDVSFAVSDMRDRLRLEEVLLTELPDVVIIAAALKQVDTCERAPSESIKTNILGVQNLVEVIERNLNRMVNLESVVMVSTDKACEPTNVYGMSKAIAERIVTSRSEHHKTPRFVAVRYGNVLESRGSIIPLFRYQAEHAPAFTLTDEGMTRFVMTLDESIDLIIAATKYAESGETWLPTIRSMKVKDLAEIFSRLYNKPIKITGIRPGEKLHEMLISETESLRLLRKRGFYVLKSAMEPVTTGAQLEEHSSAEGCLTVDELEQYLNSLGILSADINKFIGSSIEEIRQD